jgi:hypothetical protein
VLHDDRDRIRFHIQRFEQRVVRALLHRAFGQLFVVSKNVDGIVQIRSRELVRHNAIFSLLLPLFNPIGAPGAGRRVPSNPLLDLRDPSESRVGLRGRENPGSKKMFLTVRLLFA